MIEDKTQSWLIDEIVEVARESTNDGFNEHNATREAETLVEKLVKKLTIPVVSFELPSDEIFDMPEVNLSNPLEEFYYYERPPYLKSDQKDFKERLQKALIYLKGN